MKKIFHLLVLIFVFSSTRILAQVEGGALTKLTPKKVPYSYLFPKGKVEGASCQRLDMSSGAYNSKYWFVYSDRDDNPTYKEKGLITPKSKISFREVFIVADETDKALRLVVFDPSNFAIDDSKDKAVFLPIAQDAGWIEKSKVLLWSNCLVDSTTSYAKKAVAVKKVDEKTGFESLIKRGVLDFYNAPVADKNYENGKDVKLFQYLFIFKEENNMLLLGNVNVVRANTFQYDIYGWVSKSQIQEWSSAICLRINFDEAAIEDRQKKDLKPKFFRKYEDALAYKDGKNPESLIYLYSSPSENDKDNPYFLGYPIISQPDPKVPVFKTGYITNIVDGQGTNVFSAVKGAEIDSTGNDIINNKRKINVVFVLDGAERGFYRTLAKALDNNANIGNVNLTKNKYLLGSVTYNDKSCPELLTKYSFKSNKDAFIGMLEEEGAKQVSCVDRTAGAPLNDALIGACNFFNNDKTTNVIIVIGNVTASDQAKREAALDALVRKNVKMFFFQTSNRGGRYYDNYVRDCKYLLEQMSNSKDKDFEASIAKNKHKKSVFYCEGEHCKLVNSAIPGEYWGKDDGKQFTGSEMNIYLRNLLDKIETDINETVAIFEQQKGTEKKIVEDESQLKEFQSWLMDEGFSQNVIDKLSTMNNFQLFIEGYTALKPKDATYPIFERTLFVAEKEFQKILESLEKLGGSYAPGEKRRGVVEASKNIILAYKGKMDDAQIEKLTIENVYNLITGLSTTNQLFKKKLKDIENPKTTSDQEIDKLQTSMQQVFRKIKEVKKNPNYKYEQDDQLFYWVPESKLNVEE